MQTHDIQIIIPRLLRRIRLERKLNQEDLANLASLDRTYISDIERGVRNISIKSLSKILSALELTVEGFAMDLIYENKITNC